MIIRGIGLALQGFGCLVLAHDLKPSEGCQEMGVQYVSLEELLQRSDVVSLHCPLVPSTKHTICADRYTSSHYSFLFCCLYAKRHAVPDAVLHGSDGNQRSDCS